MEKIIQDLNTSVVTIDGGAGSGKSTTSEILAKKTGYHHLDNGLYYRALGFKAKKDGVNFSNKKELIKIAQDLDIQTKGTLVLLNGKDATETIKSPEVGVLASLVSPILEVREIFRIKQLSHRKPPGLIANGRDMGEIFDTPMKFFLKVSIGERARRKLAELEKKGIRTDLKEILSQITERDRADRTRTLSPLSSQDKKIICGDGKTAEEVARRIFFHCVEYLPRFVVFGK